MITMVAALVIGLGALACSSQKEVVSTTEPQPAQEETAEVTQVEKVDEAADLQATEAAIRAEIEATMEAQLVGQTPVGKEQPLPTEPPSEEEPTVAAEVTSAN